MLERTSAEIARPIGTGGLPIRMRAWSSLVDLRGIEALDQFLGQGVEALEDAPPLIGLGRAEQHLAQQPVEARRAPMVPCTAFQQSGKLRAWKVGMFRHGQRGLDRLRQRIGG